MGMLEDIYQYDQSLRECIQEKYNKLYWEYEENEWLFEREKFKENILYQIAGHKSPLDRLKRYQPIFINEFSSSEQGCANTPKPYNYIYRNRKKLSQDDLHSIFYRLHCKRTLENCIAYFDMVKEPEHKLVFKNKAAEELVTMLMPIITQYDGFKHAYQHVVVLMVCDDLKLTQTDNSRRGADYVAYMNPLLKEEFWASDSSTYNPHLRKLKGEHFGKLSKDNYYNTEYNDIEFEKLKDVYWYTLSVINKVLGMELPSGRFAGYLHDEHPQVRAIKDFANVFAKSEDRNRLFLLRDVLNGEIKEFLEL